MALAILINGALYLLIAFLLAVNITSMDVLRGEDVDAKDYHYILGVATLLWPLTFLVSIWLCAIWCVGAWGRAMRATGRYLTGS